MFRITEMLSKDIVSDLESSSSFSEKHLSNATPRSVCSLPSQRWNRTLILKCLYRILYMNYTQSRMLNPEFVPPPDPSKSLNIQLIKKASLCRGICLRQTTKNLSRRTLNSKRDEFNRFCHCFVSI